MATRFAFENVFVICGLLEDVEFFGDVDAEAELLGELDGDSNNEILSDNGLCFILLVLGILSLVFLY
jgi:hypothetical protein